MTTLAQGRTVEQWIEHLNGRCQKIVDSAVNEFVELGADLREAKGTLSPANWQKVLEGFRFGEGTAYKLIRINKWLHKPQIKEVENCLMSNLVDLLPPDYNTIDQITRLEPATLKKLVQDKTITPALGRNELQRVLNAEKVKADEARVLQLRPRPGKYRTIVVDPAWEYDEFSRNAVAGKIGQYAKQTYDDLWNLDLRQWADEECHLYCWATNAYVLKAGALIEHWGFEYKQILTWVKPSIGLGKNFRNSTEQVLFAMVGRHGVRAGNLATHFTSPRGDHSEKPEEFYNIVRQASYPPYGEANQCKLRPDFTDLFMAGEALTAAE